MTLTEMTKYFTPFTYFRLYYILYIVLLLQVKSIANLLLFCEACDINIEEEILFVNVYVKLLSLEWLTKLN